MKLQDKLKQDITLLDGGFGTTVEQFGYDVKHPLWSSNLIKHQPEAVYQVHKAFVDSGADIILTNTYQAAVPSFLNSGLTRDDAVYYLQQAVTLARRAATDQTIVAGSLGPYGAMLGNGAEYTGDYEVTAEDYIHYHQERLDILIAAGITVFAFETVPNVEEIKAIKTLLSNYDNIECWLSVTLRDKNHLSDGTSLKDVCEIVSTIKNIHAFGVNCTSAKVIDAAVEGLLQHSKHPLILYPNGGRTYDAEKKIWIDQEDSSLVEAAVRWKEQGVKIIGGCCQVGPEEIGEVVKNFKV
ncbi:homocysteine S-methyltransferase [Macrococcus carouselicus]|uniref:Homocysteine S-methyltransferase n=1 Tax=Macrococcus carouselicus TaxID=69969 RepID=A0A9Q8CP19_9STAP|nr:homocysteine S-methyltransferase [Macrococcus carouselicus]TDM04696.1 homocysteine S-methyltransferase [Macrococcus carouselicus]